jgi:hypothetical protein
MAAIFEQFAKSLLIAISRNLENSGGPVANIFTLAYDPFWIGIIHAGGGFVGMFWTAVLTRYFEQCSP